MGDFGRRHVLCALAAAGCGGVAASLAPGRRAAAAMMRRPASAEGRRFGTAVRPEYLADGAPAAALIGSRCGLIVPEWHAQWSAVEAVRGHPWFDELDRVAAFAADRAIPMRGHALLWEQMTPDWARAALRDGEGWAVIDRHFAIMLGRYDTGTVPEWIVVNECIDTEDGDAGLRRTSVQAAFGADYVRRALDTAHAISPATRLWINDYSLEYDNPVDARRRDALLRLVERLRRDGAPLHGVGIQAHLELAKGRIAAAPLARFLDDLAATGVDIAITELDVLEADRAAPLARRDALVADATREFLDVVDTQPAVTSVATWGLFDHDSWLQERDPATRHASTCRPLDCAALNRGLPFAADLAPKRMWSMLTV